MDDTLFLVALSGGVDSAVACRLILQEHSNVIGVSHRHWPESRCCSTECLDLCADQCANMNIDYVPLDCMVDFANIVVENFVKTYQKGQTPNPCVFCNEHIRFDVMIKKFFKERPSRHKDNYKVVTGHYARTVKRDGIYHLRRGKDLSKDQSYMLYRLSSEQLSHCVFPLGDFFKTEVRKMAEEFHLRSAKKKDSQDICFIKNTYQNFLKDYTQSTPPKGLFVDKKGKTLGEHNGISYYTRGQRKGLGLGGGPWYVLETNHTNNTIVLGAAEDLNAQFFEIHQTHWTNPDQKFPLEAQIQLRYHTELLSARIEKKEEDLYQCELSTPSHNITSGQSVVVYEDDCVLGGGLMLYVRS